MVQFLCIWALLATAALVFISICFYEEKHKHKNEIRHLETRLNLEHKFTLRKEAYNLLVKLDQITEWPTRPLIRDMIEQIRQSKKEEILEDLVNKDLKS